MPKTISPDVRPKIYAALELLLDVWHIARTSTDVDPESLMIYLCIMEATMRPLLLADESPPEALTSVHPDEAYRGSISRLLVAERLDLPRETVRRKITAMVKAGLLMQDKEGRVRVVSRVTEASVLAAPEQVHAAVLRYHQRLKSFGVSYPNR
ncbi:MAG TPA: hypothetical protein VIA80_04805 [Hyphomonadaceae bacterium]|jgi:DNA-binding transcriptional ArsR family regulator